MRQYEIFEIAYNGPVLEKDWASVDMTAEFTDTSGTKTVKGFYAGDGVYKVRFLPEVTGEVSWKVNGVITAEGKEICEPAAEGRHGIVRAEGTGLKHADGQYFFSFGTTVYALAHQNEEITEQTFATLSENPFNKVRMCVFPKHYDYNVNDPKYFPFELNEGMNYVYDRGETFCSEEYKDERAKLWNVNRPCFAFYDALEEKIKRLDQMGIQVDLIVFHPYDRWGFANLTQDQNLIYLDYMQRRLSAFPNIWWSMSNEYDLIASKTKEDWFGIEDYIAKNDPYKHMLSNHNCFSLYDFSRENITHCSIQKRTLTWTADLMKQHGKPVLYDECVYEGNLKQTWGSISGKEMMNRFWKVSTQGGYCTHGEVYLDADMEDIDNAVLWWAKGGKLIGTSPKRIAFLRQLIEEIGSPLSPYVAGFAGFLAAARENEFVLNSLPDGLKNMVNSQLKMTEKENVLHFDAETDFVGHTADDSHILYYFGTDCHARVDIDLPSEGTYRIEVIDAWEMTRETILNGVNGSIEVKLPGHEYMAVLCTRE